MTDYNTTVCCPIYYKIIQRRGKGQDFKYGEPFINLFNAPSFSPKEECKIFGTSMKKVAIELFRINGGKKGYYIANILDKKYYYCGSEWEDVKNKLKELGIGRENPIKYQFLK